MAEIDFEEIKYFKASEADTEFLLEVYFSTRCDEFLMFGWGKEQIRSFLQMQFYSQKQGYYSAFPDAEHLILTSKNEKIGRIILNQTTDELRLVDISLLLHFRNLGIGTKIIEKLKITAIENGLTLTLRVAANNLAAFKLYQKLDFEIIDQNEMYISMKWQEKYNLGETNV